MASIKEKQDEKLQSTFERKAQTPVQRKAPVRHNTTPIKETTSKENPVVEKEEPRERRGKNQRRARQKASHRTLLLINSLTLTAVPRLDEAVLCCHDPVLPVGLPGDDSAKMYSPST